MGNAWWAVQGETMPMAMTAAQVVGMLFHQVHVKALHQAWSPSILLTKGGWRYIIPTVGVEGSASLPNDDPSFTEGCMEEVSFVLGLEEEAGFSQVKSLKLQPCVKFKT